MSRTALPVERGHQHELVPLSDRSEADGVRTLWAKCGCGVEEKRFFRQDADGNWWPWGIEVKLGGVWLHPLDIMRRADVRLAECPACHGDPDPRAGACQVCLEMGVVEEDGHPIRLRVPAAIQPPTLVDE